VAVVCPRGAHAASLKPRAAALSDALPAPPRAPGPSPAPSPPLAPAPPIGSRRRSRRAGFRAQAGAVLLVALVAGFAAWATVRARDERLRPPAGDRVVTVGGVSLAVPPDWRPATRPAGVVPGLGGPTAILDPFPGMSVHAVVALAPHDVPTALTDLMGPLGAGRSAQLAGLPAVAYAERPVPGDRIAELTVARTPSGVLVVACIGRTGSWPGAADCADQIEAMR
jgi:hypothetical protein